MSDAGIWKVLRDKEQFQKHRYGIQPPWAFQVLLDHGIIRRSLKADRPYIWTGAVGMIEDFWRYVAQTMSLKDLCGLCSTTLSTFRVL
jgi:hypothetical protein